MVQLATPIILFFTISNAICADHSEALALATTWNLDIAAVTEALIQTKKHDHNSSKQFISHAIKEASESFHEPKSNFFFVLLRRELGSYAKSSAKQWLKHDQNEMKAGALVMARSILSDSLIESIRTEIENLPEPLQRLAISTISNTFVPSWPAAVTALDSIARDDSIPMPARLHSVSELTVHASGQTPSLIRNLLNDTSLALPVKHAIAESFMVNHPASALTALMIAGKNETGLSPHEIIRMISQIRPALMKTHPALSSITYNQILATDDSQMELALAALLVKSNVMLPENKLVALLDRQENSKRKVGHLLLMNDKRSFKLHEYKARLTNTPQDRYKEINHMASYVAQKSNLSDEMVEKVVQSTFRAFRNADEQSYLDLVADHEQTFKHFNVKEKEHFETVYRGKHYQWMNKQARGKDPCQTVCGLIKNKDAWLDKRYLRAPKLFRHFPGSYESALSTLASLFIAKAAPLCPQAIPLRNHIEQHLISQLENKTAPGPASGIQDAILKLAELPNISTITQGRIVSEIPVSGPDLFTRQFYSTLVRDFLSDNSDQMDQLLLEKTLKETEKRHFTMLGNHRLYKDESVPNVTRTNSVMTTFAVAASLISLPTVTPNSPFEDFRDLAERLSRNQFSLQVPYFIGGNLRSKRSSAARNVPFYLALYLRDPKGGEKWEPLLRAALHEFVRKLPALMAHTRRNGTHLSKYLENIDGVAPYYYWGSIPYVSSAIEVLKRRGTTPRRELETLHHDIKLSLLSMLQDNGLFSMMGNDGPISLDPELGQGELYPGSKLYNQALGGLALIPLCAQQQGKASYGIVDTQLSKKVAPVSISDKTESKKDHSEPEA